MKQELSDPLINTTGGVRLKPEAESGFAWSLSTAFADPLAVISDARCAKLAAGCTRSSSATLSDGPLGKGTPAAAHASGRVIPARLRAAAIFPCWVICVVEEGAGPLASRTTSGRETDSAELAFVSRGIW